MSRSASIPKEQALLRLLQLASPTLPVGAYSYSEGLEHAVHAGAINNVAHLRAWVEDGLEFGLAQLEAAVLTRVYDAWRQDDIARVRYWDRWLGATRETEELRHQSLDMGRALLRLLKDLEPPLPQVHVLFASPCHYVTAFGVAAAHWRVDRDQAVTAYLQSWATNLVSAGIKLIPLGQTAGQQLLWDLQQAITQATRLALQVEDENISVGNWGMTLASMAHETQYMRLFRS